MANKKRHPRKKPAKPYSSDESMAKEAPAKEGKIKSTNDPSYYTLNSDMIAAAANISYAWPIGQPLGVHWYDNFPVIPSNDYLPDSVPGIMSMAVVTTPGKSVDARSPLNKAAMRLITNIRHTRSGTASYAPADLVQYLLMVDTLYQMYAVSCRLYGTLSLVSQRNYYLPKALVQAQGFDFDDMRANHANLRYFIYDLAEDISRWAVPNDISFFLRHIELFSNVYMDANDPKAQMYLYVPDQFLIQDSNDQGATLLGNLGSLMDASDATGLTYQYWVQAIQSRTAAMHLMPHIGQISTDILNYYSDSRVMHVPAMPENYALQFMFNDAVLYQFRNATLNSRLSNDYNVTQSGDLVIYNPEFKNNEPLRELASYAPLSARVLSAMSRDPDALETMEITRLTNTADAASVVRGTAITDPIKYKLTSFGTEIATRLKVWFYNQSGVLVGEKVYGTASDENLQRRAPIVAGLVSQFKHHPGILYGANTYSSSTWHVQLFGFDFEFDNYAVIQPEDLDRIHNAALLSELQIPMFGSWEAGK